MPLHRPFIPAGFHPGLEALTAALAPLVRTQTAQVWISGIVEIEGVVDGEAACAGRTPAAGAETRALLYAAAETSIAAVEAVPGYEHVEAPVITLDGEMRASPDAPEGWWLVTGWRAVTRCQIRLTMRATPPPT